MALFLLMGSGAKGQEVGLHCSLGSALPAAATLLSARRLDIALKGQSHTECRDAGFDRPRLTTKSLFSSGRKKVEDLCLALEGCGIKILDPSFLISLSNAAA